MPTYAVRHAVFHRCAILVLALGLPCSGCRSPQSAEAPLAWVMVEGRTPAAIRQATSEVFQQEGYRGFLGEMSLVFERPASAFDHLVYGDWDLHSLAHRVEVTIVPAGDGVYRLNCDAYRVRDAGDRVLSDTQRLGKLGRGPYQRLLDRVKRCLDAR